MATQNIQKIVYEYWDIEQTRIKSIKYYNANGELHRPWQEGPAQIRYFNTPANRIWVETYCENGKIHRPYREGPASIWYYNTPDNRVRLR